MSNAPVRTRSGIARVDVVALIALVAVGGSVLVTTASAGNRTRRHLTNTFIHRTLGAAQHGFMLDHDGDFAGVNTTGAFFQSTGLPGSEFPGLRSDLLLGDTTPTTPVTTADWISPILGDALGFSPNRARRFADILNGLADPMARRYNDTLFGFPTDLDDFRAVLADTGYRQVSYLQPAPFHFRSSLDPRSETDLDELEIRRYKRLDFGPAVTPSGTRANINLIGASLSGKVMHADGTRFLSDHGEGFTVLDFTTETDPSFFGPFTSASPANHGSSAYGRAPTISLTASPENIELSFRQLGGRMTTTRFDGSVVLISRLHAWTDPTLWYPGGSVWTGDDATPEALEFVAQNYPGGVLP